MPTDKSMHIAA